MKQLKHCIRWGQRCEVERHECGRKFSDEAVLLSTPCRKGFLCAISDVFRKGIFMGICYAVGW